MSERGRIQRVSAWLACIGTGGLLMLGAAYVLTYEPAPSVRVLWRAGLPAAERETLERKYLLLNGRDPLPGGSIAYDLLDTSQRNVRGLVNDPAIVDTNDIERHSFTIPFETDYGSEWMWVAHRIPGLRDAGVRRIVVAALTAMVLGGLLVGIRARDSAHDRSERDPH